MAGEYAFNFAIVRVHNNGDNKKRAFYRRPGTPRKHGEKLGRSLIAPSKAKPRFQISDQRSIDEIILSPSFSIEFVSILDRRKARFDFIYFYIYIVWMYEPAYKSILHRRGRFRESGSSFKIRRRRRRRRRRMREKEGKRFNR